jgi:hypothetical protein
MQEHDLILVREFCTQHHVETNFIYSLQDYGLIEVIRNEEEEYLSLDRLNELERIIRLHYELNINMEGIDVILHLLEQLETAQKEANELKNRLQFYHSSQ